jgi:hypothetical protein
MSDPRIEAVAAKLRGAVFPGEMATKIAMELIDASDAAAWVKIEDIPVEWKDGRVLVLFGIDAESGNKIPAHAYYHLGYRCWMGCDTDIEIDFAPTHVRLLLGGPKE